MRTSHPPRKGTLVEETVHSEVGRWEELEASAVFQRKASLAMQTRSKIVAGA